MLRQTHANTLYSHLSHYITDEEFLNEVISHTSGIYVSQKSFIILICDTFPLYILLKLGLHQSTDELNV